METLKHLFTCLLLFTVALLVSCKDKPVNPNELKTQRDLQLVKNALQVLEDPQCKSSDEFINNVLTDREKRRCTAILDRLTLNEINEMCKVIIHREGYVTRKLFLKEYDESYQRVYRYLEEDTPPKITEDTVKSIKQGNNNINIVKHGTTSSSDPIHRE